MSVDTGWIRLPRAIERTALWSLPSSQLKVFTTILFNANIRDHEWDTGDVVETICRGSLITSQQHLAERSRTTRRVVRRALENLERIGAIRSKPRANRYTAITVVDFDTYSPPPKQGGQPSVQPRANRGPTEGHNQRSREGEKERIALSFERFWNSYPRQQNQSRALRAWRALNPDDALVEVIIAAVADQKTWETWRNDGGRFIPSPAKWLQERLWTDKPPQASASPRRYDNDVWKGRKGGLVTWDKDGRVVPDDRWKDRLADAATPPPPVQRETGDLSEMLMAKRGMTPSGPLIDVKTIQSTVKLRPV